MMHCPRRSSEPSPRATTPTTPAVASVADRAGSSLATLCAWFEAHHPEHGRVLRAVSACFGDVVVRGNRAACRDELKRFVEIGRCYAAAVDAPYAESDPSPEARFLARAWRRPDRRVVGRVLNDVRRHGRSRALPEGCAMLATAPGFEAALHDAMARHPALEARAWVKAATMGMPASFFEELTRVKLAAALGDLATVFDRWGRRDYPVSVDLMSVRESERLTRALRERIG